MSAIEILNWRRHQLKKGGRAVDLDWLLDIGGGLGWSELQSLKIFQRKTYQLDISLERLSSLWLKHLNDKTPLQYLLGKCPWRDFELEVNPSALIPRQESELLIDIALEKINPALKTSGLWADLGTGSGAFAVALAKSFPGWIGHAVDCSEGAICLAEKNIKKLAGNSQVVLHLGHWWEPLEPWWGQIDLLVANPPYIPSSNLEKLDSVVLDHEPHLALCGGDDGMDCCREIIEGAIKGLSSGGWMMFEHNFDQSEKALKILTEAGFVDVDFATDLEGIRRFALARHW
ncbi:Methylase of polypeptide chain release factor [Prochlorococcus sp. MIT 0602]|uniref:peptide chain release factor N(5)-glutamine methyltransferase n=1 Tax=unclassified Prochlorococcus TaxID=2627481 RepID=UPI00053371D7|nr:MULTISPECIES: peptide chain release factor N(5)-glutamine methyltransferase [unclassified Prochlorococcus]KGG16600.1 Methylase of polypeptide chain release factor [Prochlorococcus sp. MIT 0602]